MTTLTSPAFRKWAYGLSVAIATALGTFGVLNSYSINAINFVLAALFGMAFMNTDTSTYRGRHAASDVNTDGKNSTDYDDDTLTD